MTLIRVIVLAAIVGAVLIVAGVAVLAGLGWALIAAGVQCVAGAAVLLHDDGKART